jgi:hypothetical protein
MAKTHNVTVSTTAMLTPDESLKLIRQYAATLEKAAASFEADKSAGAHYAIAATVRFLMKVGPPRHLLAPLYEAAKIIQRDMGMKTAATSKLRQERDVYDSIAVDTQLNCGAKLDDAVRKIVGNDPAAAQHLINFRKNMMSRKKSVPAGARQTYDATMRDYYKGLPPGDAMRKAMAVCRAMRGKKV